MKTKQKESLDSRIIKQAMGRSRIDDKTELAKGMGMNYQSLRRRVSISPGSMRLYEAQALDQELNLTPVEIIALVKRKEPEECEKWLRDWLRRVSY